MMCLGECVCVHDVICVAQCLKLLLIKKPPLTGTALHHTRCALALCGAECAPAPGSRVACGHVSRARARASRVPTCDVVAWREGSWGSGVWGCSNKTSLSLTLYTVL